METSFISFRYKKPFKSNWGGKQHWLSLINVKKKPFLEILSVYNNKRI